MASSSEQARKAYAEFEEKVKRTVLLDNLSPQVTMSVIKTALGQFGNVLKVEFIPNYTIPFEIPQCALVEMENPKQASAVIAVMTNFPFMMCGTPRPVRAQASAAEMFADRPVPPDRKIEVYWVEPSDPDFVAAKKLKRLCKHHNAETLALVHLQLGKEEKLAEQQEEVFETQCKKYKMVNKVTQNGSLARLAHAYGVSLTDEQN